MLRRLPFLSSPLYLLDFQHIHAQCCTRIDKSVTIIGGGIIGILEAYHSYLEAESKGETVKITVLEKNTKLSETTTCNIVPSLAPDEIMSVVPRGSDLIKFLKQKFNEGNGMKVDDVEGIDDSSDTVRHFIHSAELYGKNDEAHQVRSKALLELGKYSMELWEHFYEIADDELKGILENSNYKPCLEISSDEQELHKGYRIDLIFNDEAAEIKAENMRISYKALGYESTRKLSPSEVISIDPQLKEFVIKNSFLDSEGILYWLNDAAALWRPGGCINTGLFLPEFVKYLEKKLVTRTEDGAVCSLFEIKYDSEVIEVEIDDAQYISRVKVKNSNGGISFFPVLNEKMPQDFIFAPGEAVGTLRKFEFHEPDYAIFAGPSLQLSIDIPNDKLERYRSLDHCMEIHQEGVILAWQAKYGNSKVFIGVGGTKAFYGDKKPKLNEKFARDRHLFQLNLINKVYWDLISLALGKSSEGDTLNSFDLDDLLQKGIAKIWVGSRAVAYDGFPTLGALYRDFEIVHNARVTTHLGSGGASFALGAILLSRAELVNKEKIEQSIPPLVLKIISFSDSRR